MSTIALHSTLNISETVRGRGKVNTMDYQWEMAYGVSNGHVTDDVTCPPKVLWGSTVGYPSDSFASCYVYWRRHALHMLQYAQQAIALSDYRQTNIHTFQWLLDYEIGDFWKNIEIA